MERLKRDRPEMKNGIRNIVLTAAAVLIVGGNGAARAGETPARLALYVNGVLEFCEQGAARLRDIPYREGTSDPRTRPVLQPAGSAAARACPGSVPAALPLPAHVSAVEVDTKTLVFGGERLMIRTFIFGAGRSEGDRPR
jgi:hypothetical protein